MKFKSVIVALAVSLVQFASGNHLDAQPGPHYKESIYQAYIKGDLKLWKGVITLLEKEYSRGSDNHILQQLVMAQYGYVAFCLKDGFKKIGGRELEKAILNLDILLDEATGEPELIALKAAFTGFEMGINPLKVVFLASKARQLTDQAYKSDRESLMCLSVKANQLNFTPVIFGGSPDEAIPVYIEIIALFESGLAPVKSDWRYINTIVILAQVYESRGEYAKACELYEKIIAAERDINWVTNRLYPACLKKAGESL